MESSGPPSQDAPAEVNPVDSADTSASDFDPASLTEAAANLSPSEVPSPNEVPGIVGVLLYHAQHGELPKPLSERFPDDNPNQ